MFTLFKIMNGDMTELDPILQEVPALKIGFVLFVVTATWGLLSILSAVVFESMLAHRMDTQDEESKKKRHHELKQFFEILDQDGSGNISRLEFHTFVRDETNETKLKRFLGVRQRKLSESSTHSSATAMMD